MTKTIQLFPLIFTLLTVAHCTNAGSHSQIEAHFDAQSDEEAATALALEEDEIEGKTSTLTWPVATSASKPELASINRSAFLWKGFNHAWKRTVMGFKIPHRISKFYSFVSSESHAGSGLSWSGSAGFTFGQSTGVDGNFMTPTGHFAAIHSPGIHTLRGWKRMKWTDNGDGATYPKAKSNIYTTISIDLDRPEMAGGSLDEHVVVFRGIKLSTSCDNAKQPANEPCNSNGMWPYKMYFRIKECSKNGTSLSCPLTVQIYRAWTPNKGGLPLIEEKPFNDKLDFDLTVYFSVVAGRSDDLVVTHSSGIIRTGKGRENSPKTGSHRITGKPGGYATAISALTEFGFEFSKYGILKKNNHLGRYIGALNFHITDGSYNMDSGDLYVNYSNQVWVPDTVVNTNVKYFTRVAALQMSAVGSITTKNKKTSTSLCINSDGAPFFSKWQKCGSGDKGPARFSHTKTVSAP